VIVVGAPFIGVVDTMETENRRFRRHARRQRSKIRHCGHSGNVGRNVRFRRTDTAKSRQKTIKTPK